MADGSGLRGQLLARIRTAGPDECWDWIGGRSGKPNYPYGRFPSGGKILKAHRIVYECFVGPIPDGMSIRHACDRPECVNPAHLSFGTHAENMKDMAVRGRANKPKGTGNRAAKLAEADIPEIRRLIREGVTRSAIGRTYGVSHRTISLIALGRLWRHV